jgi:hypothetical protein
MLHPSLQTTVTVIKREEYINGVEEAHIDKTTNRYYKRMPGTEKLHETLEFYEVSKHDKPIYYRTTCKHLSAAVDPSPGGIWINGEQTISPAKLASGTVFEFYDSSSDELIYISPDGLVRVALNKYIADLLPVVRYIKSAHKSDTDKPHDQNPAQGSLFDGMYKNDYFNPRVHSTVTVDLKKSRPQRIL